MKERRSEGEKERESGNLGADGDPALVTLLCPHQEEINQSRISKTAG